MRTGPSWSGLGPELEVLAFRIGIKPALRARVPAARLPSIVPRVRERGLAVESAVIGDEVLIYVAREAARAEALREAEALVVPGSAPRAPDDEVIVAHRELGRLLGYPRCCVEAYLERLVRDVHVRRDGSRASEEVVAAEDALSRSTTKLARLNTLVSPTRALVPFQPCSFDCDVSARYAERLFDALRERHPAEAETLRTMVCAELRVAIDGRLLDADDEREAALVLSFDRF